MALARVLRAPILLRATQLVRLAWQGGIARAQVRVIVVYVVLIHSVLLQPRYAPLVRQVVSVLVVALHVRCFLLDSRLVSLLVSPLVNQQAPLANPRGSRPDSPLVNLLGSRVREYVS